MYRIYAHSQGGEGRSPADDARLCTAGSEEPEAAPTERGTGTKVSHDKHNTPCCLLAEGGKTHQAF